MTTIRGQRPAVSLQPNLAKKGLAGRCIIFHVSTIGAEDFTTTAAPGRRPLRGAGKNEGIKISKRGNPMELAIYDTTCAAQNMQLIVFDNRDGHLTRSV